MLDQNQIESLSGKDVYGSDGEKIGSVGQVHVDDQTGDPAWATVDTGLLGMNQSVVPLGPAEFYEDHVQVPFPKDVVQGAPHIESDGVHLSPEQEQELYRHYGMRGDETVSDVNGTIDVELTDDDRRGLAERVDTLPAEAGPWGDDPPDRPGPAPLPDHTSRRTP